MLPQKPAAFIQNTCVFCLCVSPTEALTCLSPAEILPGVYRCPVLSLRPESALHSLIVAFPENDKGHLTLRENSERAHPHTMQTYLDASGVQIPTKVMPRARPRARPRSEGATCRRSGERPPTARRAHPQWTRYPAAAEGAPCCLAALCETAPPQSCRPSFSQHYEGGLSTCVLPPKKRHSSNKTRQH